MFRISPNVCLIGLLSLFAFTGSAQDASDHFPGQVLVQLDPGFEPTELIERIDRELPQADLDVLKCLSQRMNMWQLTFDPQVDEQLVLQTVNREYEVVAAQFNHSNVTLRATPNDPLTGGQWPFNNNAIDAELAWDITTGGQTINGDEIVVAVIDGGADLNHEDIDYYQNPGEIPNNNQDDDNNGYVDDVSGWNAYQSSGNVPSNNHGTHVSGTVGAKGNNGIGVTGVNWDVKILPIAGSSGNEAIVLEAYGYALELRATYNQTNGAEGAYVVATNSSFGVDFGNPANFPLWCNFYDSLGVAGVLSAGATANLPINIDQQGDVPTACSSDYMIAVTNTTNQDQLNNSAGFGATTIDLGAPGTGILSTRPNDNYGNSTGTSMATPHVAGAVALMYSAMCQGLLNNYANNPGGLALFVKDKLLDGVDPIPALSSNTVSGGRLNLLGAVQGVTAGSCISVIATTEQTGCEDPCTGSIMLNATDGAPPYTYAWSHDNTLITDFASGLCAGTYTTTVTDMNNDQSIITHVITEFDRPQTTFSQQDVLCPGFGNGSASVDSPGYTYLWSNGETTQQISNLSGGPYSVTVFGTAGCDTSYLFLVNEPDSLILDDSVQFESGLNAMDASITINSITGGTPPYFPSWSDGDTNLSRTGLGAGNYQLFLQDSQGCFYTFSYDITGVGIGDELIKQELVKVFPNPNDGRFTIEPIGLKGTIQLELLDVLGRTVHTESMNAAHRLEINVSEYGSGMYFLRAIQDNGTQTIRLLVR